MIVGMKSPSARIGRTPLRFAKAAKLTAMQNGMRSRARIAARAFETIGTGIDQKLSATHASQSEKQSGRQKAVRIAGQPSITAPTGIGSPTCASRVLPRRGTSGRRRAARVAGRRLASEATGNLSRISVNPARNVFVRNPFPALNVDPRSSYPLHCKLNAIKMVGTCQADVINASMTRYL